MTTPAPLVDTEPIVPVATAAAAHARKPETTPATFEQLRAKKRRRDVVRIPTTDEDGQPIELAIKIQAIGGVAYDELLAKHPPTPEQRSRNMAYNIDTFLPALVSECTVTPKLSYVQVQELYQSDDWSGGEMTALFTSCLRVNNGGTDIPFSASV